MGGWLSTTANAQKSEVWLFMETTKKSTHNWAYDKGSSQKKTSSLEVFGSDVLVKLILQTCTYQSVVKR